MNLAKFYEIEAFINSFDTNEERLAAFEVGIEDAQDFTESQITRLENIARMPEILRLAELRNSMRDKLGGLEVKSSHTGNGFSCLVLGAK